MRATCKMHETGKKCIKETKTSQAFQDFAILPSEWQDEAQDSESSQTGNFPQVSLDNPPS